MAQVQGQTAPAPKKRSGPSELAKAEERTALWLLAPTFFILFAIGIYPLGQVVVQSFTNARFASAQPTEFVGLQNYRALLGMTVRELPPIIDEETGEQEIRDGEPRFENPRLFLRQLDTAISYSAVTDFGLFGRRYVLGATSAPFVRAIWDTIIFTVFNVGLATILGMIIALALSVKFFGRSVMRAAMLVPWAVITVVSARIWEWMFQSSRAGFFNAFLSTFNITNANISFLTDPAWQLPSMIAIDVWKTTPFMALLLLAGLSTIPAELYEAARVDGANRVRQFFSITLPLLTPTLAVALVFRTLDSLRVFDLFQVVLGQRRYSLASFTQDMLISNRAVGISSASSVIIFAILLVFAIIYIRMLGVDTE